MTGPEIDDWIEGLAASDNKRLDTILELLRNAIGDQMSPEDRIVCVNAMRRLYRRDKTERVDG